MALLSLVWTPYDPIGQEIPASLQGPSLRHLLGTDQYGRDVLSRVMVGAQVTLLVGLVAVGIGFLLGTAVGIWAGLGGWAADEVAMRGMDVLFAFPAVLTALLLWASLGKGVVTSTVAIGIASTPLFARLARSGVAVVRELDYVAAARAIGLGRAAVALRHILPNVLSPLIVQATIEFAVAILAEAGLSYLGLGTQPPFPSWGRMLREAQTFLGIAPHLAVFPGLAILLAVLGTNLLGDGLRDLLDPRLPSRVPPGRTTRARIP
jgi:peptide/nickel transport system permease protein